MECNGEPEHALPRARYEVAISGRGAGNVKVTYVFREPTGANRLTSIP
jgi:hypothetical protein